MFETGPAVTFKDFNGPGMISELDIGPEALICRIFLAAPTIPKPVDASGLSLQLTLGASITAGEFVVES